MIFEDSTRRPHHAPARERLSKLDLGGSWLRTMTSPPPTARQQLSPELSLDLRLRFLETLLAGAPSSSRPTPQPSLSIARRSDLAQARLKEALETGGGGDAVRRFVQGCKAPFPSPRAWGSSY